MIRNLALLCLTAGLVAACAPSTVPSDRGPVIIDPESPSQVVPGYDPNLPPEMRPL